MGLLLVLMGSLLLLLAHAEWPGDGSPWSPSGGSVARPEDWPGDGGPWSPPGGSVVRPEDWPGAGSPWSPPGGSVARPEDWPGAGSPWSPPGGSVVRPEDWPGAGSPWSPPGGSVVRPEDWPGAGSPWSPPGGSVARPEDWPGAGSPWSPPGGSVVRPQASTVPALLLSHLSSHLEATKRHQRQIRFKSSYRELPAGLKPTFLDGASQDLEGLSYFIQVDVDDPPASTALTKLPKGARTYFPPQLSEPGASLLQEKDSDDRTITQKALLVGRSSSRSPAFSQGATGALGKALLRSKTELSPQVAGLTLEGFGLKSMNDNALVTSPSTSTLRTYLHSEAFPSMTENPNVIPKGATESSSYTSYSPTASQTSQDPSTQQDHKLSSTSALSSAPSSVTPFSSSLRSSPSSSYSPPRIHSATPSSSKSISISFFTPSESTPSSSASHSFSSSSTAASTAIKSPSISPASNTVSSHSSLTSSQSTLTPKPSTYHSSSSNSFTTTPPVSSTAKSVTTPSVSSVSDFFITSVGSSVVKQLSDNSFIAVPLESSTAKSFTASPSRSSASKSRSFHSFPTPSSSSSRSKSVTNYSFKSSSPSIFESFSPSLSGKHSRIHLTKRPPSLTIHSGASSSSSKIPPSTPPSHRSQKSFSQVTRPSSRPSSTVLPKRSSTVTNKVIFVTKPLQTLSPPQISGRSPASSKTLTNSYTLTRHRSRHNNIPSSGNVVTQSKPEPRAKSLSSSPTNSFQDITASRRGGGGGGGGGKSGGGCASVSKTPDSDGKTSTVGSSDDPYTGSIPGRSGVDYPTLLTIPKTGFNCSTKPSGGYYADVEANCQVFHVCWSGGRAAAFLCPVGTVFSQRLLVCDWWHNVDCSATHTFLSANHGFWQPTAHSNRL